MIDSANNPLVSIIVRTKDRPKLLSRALQSIATQTYRPIEVVLVNDGGCDLDIEELKGILGDIALNYIRLEQNTGRSHAGNVGIENTQGKYIGFLDDDDEYYKDAIAVLCSAMDFGGWPVVYGQVVLKHYNEEGTPNPFKKDFLYAFAFDREVLLYRNFIPFNAFLFDKSLFKKFGPLDESLAICEDWDFLLRVSDEYSFRYVPRLVAEYSSFGSSLGGGGRFAEEEIQKHEAKIRLKRLDSATLSKIKKNVEFAIRTYQEIHDKSEAEKSSLSYTIETPQAENKQLKDTITEYKAELAKLLTENKQLKDTITEYKAEVQKIQNTLSWKITAPLRTLRRWQRGHIYPTDPFITKIFVYIKKSIWYIKTYGVKAFSQKVYSKVCLLRKLSLNNIGLPVLSLPSPEVYNEWLRRNRVTIGELIDQKQEALSWSKRPFISIIVPVFNTFPKWLDFALQSVHEQSYDRWEGVIVDDCSSNDQTISVIKDWLRRDNRFSYLRRDINGGVASASQDGLMAAKGEFVLILDHDDILEPDALYHVAKKILDKPEVDVIYSDEILIDSNGTVLRICFRPDFSIDYLLSHPYIVHLVTYRRDLAISIGGYNPDYEVSQDYELLLKMAARSCIFEHIPRPLYRWRIHPASTGHQKQDKVMSLSKKAINNYLKEVEEKDAYAVDGPAFNFFRVRRKIKPSVVDIVIPTRDSIDLLKKCINSLLMKTTVPEGVKYNIIVADNGSVQKETLQYFEYLKTKGVTIVDCGGPFNFSSINNRAVAVGRGDLILFLNNDVEIIESEWLQAMLEQAQRPELGAVGAKLLYPEGIIQHAGVIIGINGVAAHSHQFFPEYRNGHIEGGHLDSLLCIRDCMAVTAACMMVKRSIFEAVGGFDENFVVGFGDTDLCLKIYRMGFKIIWTPYAKLIHHESVSRGKSSLESHMNETTLMRLKWQDIIIKGDPYYNPNLSYTSNNFSPK